MGGVPQKPIYENVCVQYEMQIVGWENDYSAIEPRFDVEDNPETSTSTPVETDDPITRIVFPDGPDIPVIGPPVVVIPGGPPDLSPVDAPSAASMFLGFLVCAAIIYGVYRWLTPRQYKFR